MKMLTRLLGGTSVPPDLGAVLLVEDEPALRRANARILTSAGYTVTEAGDGAQAFEAFSERSFDLVLSDITMPEMDGVELLRRIRSKDPDVPVLLLTANPAVDSAMQAVEFGALKYLLKPIGRRELVKTVEEAVKAGRKARYQRRATEMMGNTTTMMLDHSTMDAALDRAIKSIVMAYQPIVNWRTRAVVAYEALVRTRERDLPNPGVLFAVAERLGKVLELGRAIRRTIAQTLQERAPGVDVYVNLHAQELKDESLYDPNAPLSQFADRIVLEITEREALDESGDARECVARLRQLGYRIAVDDLGAGNAGLSSFAKLNPDVAKIDMSLIRNLHMEGIKRSLVRSIVNLCHELDVRVIAEGIETPEECIAAAELGCDVLQGFLFAKPSDPFADVQWNPR